MYNIGTKQLIYQTAKRLFLEEGYNVGSRKIASEAEVNQGLLTYYFKNKENIAIMVLNEIYQFAGIHLKYFIDPEKNILLYMISFINFMAKITSSHSGYARFLTQIAEHNIMEKSVISGGSERKNYERLIRTYLPDSKEPERDFYVLVALIFGTHRNLAPKINQVDQLSYDDLFEVMVRCFYTGLNLPYDNKTIHDMVDESNAIVEKMFEEYQTLKELDIWLFQEKKIEEKK